MLDILAQLKEKHLNGETGGMISICSAHPMVLQAAMQTALKYETPLLVEATAAQVNQFGGYTGMTPGQFTDFVKRLAGSSGFPREKVMIGADHLGPHLWKNEPAELAMQKAEVLVRQCVAAGFEKIHLDTATPCLDDSESVLPMEVIAMRAARICLAAETMSRQMEKPDCLFYVIGDEAPVPGGGLEEEMKVSVTETDKILLSLDQYKKAFGKLGIDSAFSRVVGLVVQPGVDFGDKTVAAYEPMRAAALCACHDQLPGIMTYEIHGTDYQTPEALKHMVRDHFILLKTGPCLTFALRKTLYALTNIETDLPEIVVPSNLIQIMENLMIANPVHWQSHYRGTEDELKSLRHNSLRDRIRYYWPMPSARNAVARLIQNLNRLLPASLLERYLPELNPQIQELGLFANPAAILRLSVRNEITAYMNAMGRTG